MKKVKLLFVIILLIPITIYAKNIEDLKHKWTESFDGTINYFEEDNNSITISTGNNIHKINVNDGKTKTITISEGIKDVISVDNYLFVYSLTGSYNSYKIHIYKIDKELKIVKKDELITGITYPNGKFQIYNDDLYLEDYHSGYLIKKDTTIIPLLLNSDESYWIKSYNTYALYNKSGKLIKEIEDIGNKIIKYNTDYVVIDEIDKNSNKESKYKIYLYDETLTNVKKSLDMTLMSDNLNLIRDKNGNIYLENYYYNKDYTDYYQYYQISQNLELTKTEKPKLLIDERNKEHFRHYDDNSVKNYDKLVSTQEEQLTILKKLRDYHQIEEKEEIVDNVYLSIRDIYKDENNNYVVNYVVHLYPPKTNKENPGIFYISYINDKNEILFTNELFKITNSNIIGSIFMHGVPYVVSNKIDKFICVMYIDESNTYNLHIYNEKGELVNKEVILNDKKFRLIWTMKKTDNGLLIVLDNRKPITGLSNNESPINPSYLFKEVNTQPTFLNNNVKGTALIYYAFPYYIKTKTDGYGEIKVINKAESGEEIKYEVIPNDGYEIKEIKVTDKKGNVVTFTNNKFTMPYSDVLIEATFIKKAKNPETSDYRIVYYIIIIMLSLSIIIYNIKNKTKCY